MTIYWYLSVSSKRANEQK